MTWNDLKVLTDDRWPMGSAWYYYTSESEKLVFGHNNGHLYTSTSEGDDDSNWDGYRIEPIIPFPDERRFKRILEIWASIAEMQSHSIDIYWRGGDTVAEVEGQPWILLGSISMNNPSNAVLYVDRIARLHQIKWGTDLKSEPFSVNTLRFGFQMQGGY